MNNKQGLITKMQNVKTNFEKQKKLRHRHSERVSIAGNISHLLELEPTATVSRQDVQQHLSASNKDYNEGAPSTKRRKLAQVAQSASGIPVEDVLLGYLRRCDPFPQKADLAKVIQYCLMTPGKAEKVWHYIQKEKKGKDSSPYTIVQSIGIIFKSKLTQEAYIEMRKNSKVKDSHIYPSYVEIQKGKLLLCPDVDKLNVTETYAAYPLQDLLDHTVGRIVEMNSEVLDRILTADSKATFRCHFSWGFDGSTGQSNYKQKFTQPDCGPHTDSSLFATTIIPLMIVNGLPNRGDILWLNTVPQSIRFCRPLELHFVKESTDVIKIKRDKMEKQITELRPFTVTRNDREITFSYDLCMTIIDGKVLNVVSSIKSHMSCPICEKNPRDFNVASNINDNKFRPIPSRLKHGLSPLHAYIRLLELALHISYKLPLKTWQARGEAAKKIVEDRKRAIQESLFQEMGLRVDFPSPGGSGNSNDGNTARRAFANYQTFARILELDEELLKRFRILLISISHSYPLDSEKFGDFCLDTARLYIAKYPWYYMSATLHKILIHGKDVVENSLLPIGMYSEQAGESRNKIYKEDRGHHARKSSRYYNMRDTMLRSVQATDPIVATSILSRQQKPKNKQNLPTEALQLLQAPIPPASAKSTSPSEVCRSLFEEDNDDVIQDMEMDSDEIVEGVLESEEDSIDLGNV